MKKTFTFKGTKGKIYDLDKIKNETRTNADKELVIQIHEYDPSDPESTVNPKDLKRGQLWMTVKKGS